MTAAIAPTTSSAPAATSADRDALGKAALNKNDFLQMLVAQMKNQDPMNPMQGTEFATQLAQFSSVEQLIHLNEKLDAQGATAQAAANTTLGIAMVGKNVLVPGNGIDVNASEVPQVSVELPTDASQLTVQVIDAAGKTVATGTFTDVAAGRQSFDLGDAALDPGHYTYKVSALAADGTAIKGTTYSTAHVQGMSNIGGEILIRINGTLLPLSQVVEVVAPSPAPAPAKPVTTTQGATQS